MTDKFTLRGISAIKTILPYYAVSTKRTKVMTLEEDKYTLPQTPIGLEGDDIGVTDLLHEKSKRAYYFIDNRKVQTKWWPVMIDVTSNGPLSKTTSKMCWHDHHPIPSSLSPIGCPIRYNSNKTVGVEKERFEEKLKLAGLAGSDKQLRGTNDFFETEGYFCSFPCCKSYIIRQGCSARYKDSLTLLSLLHQIMYPSADREFPSAPSWKILKEYGGHLNIDEFRSTFGKLEYEETVNTRRPYMFCSSQYISERRIKLFRSTKD